MEARAQTIVAQRYALHERVGQGGCGVVYRATDQTSGKTVAVKMLSRAARQNPSFVERLVREQQALLALAGTHAVAAIDLCRADTGELCLVMEWLEGADLEQHLSTREQNGTRFAVDELLQVMRPVLETLAKAHELGIVHRDVKPANIFLLSEDRGVRLLDFGFSRLKSSATLTAADTVMGSPSYIAPEAWLEGSKAIGKQADLYAAGVIVFRALAGRVPFEGASLVETMRLVTTAPRPRLSELRPELPRMMDEWFECALAVAPERRFQHAQSFLEALSAALAGVAMPAHTLPSGEAHALPPPPPKTTPGERQNALSTALGRAASLLKRVASSFSRAPTPATPPTPGAPSLEPPRAERPGLAPPPRSLPSRVRTKPALPPLVRPRGNSDELPTANAVSAVGGTRTANTDHAEPASEVPSSPLPESDLLIAELLPPSLPPPAPPAEALSAPSPPSDFPAPAPPPSAPETFTLTPALEPALPTALALVPEAPASATSSPTSSTPTRPRTAKRPAKKAATAKAATAKAATAKAATAKAATAKAPSKQRAKPGAQAKPRKSTGTATKEATTATKEAAAATKTAPKSAARAKPTAAAKPTSRKQNATKKPTRAVAATPPQATQEHGQSPALTGAAGGAVPKPSASMPPPAGRRPSRGGQRSRASQGSSKRTRDKAVNLENGTVDKVDKVDKTPLDRD